jgi:hypothetical protein
MANPVWKKYVITGNYKNKQELDTNSAGNCQEMPDRTRK